MLRTSTISSFIFCYLLDLCLCNFFHNYITTIFNSRYLGIIGIPPPLQQQQASPGLEIEDPEIVQARAICSALPGLASKQVDVCMKHPNAIYSVSDGAKKAIEQCQFEFRHERWNCSVMENEQSVFGPTLDRGLDFITFYSVKSPTFIYHLNIN